MSHYVKTGDLIINMGDKPMNIYINYHNNTPYHLLRESDYPIELSVPNNQIYALFDNKPTSQTNFGTPAIGIVQPSIETLNERIKDRDNQITALNERIAELERQLKIPSDDELHPRTANNASKIILAMAELLKWDLSKPHAKETNGVLQEVLERQGNKLSKDTIGYWFKQAYDIGK